MTNDRSELWHYQDPSTKTSVAAHLGELEHLFREGTLNGSTYVWSESLTDWTLAANVPKFHRLCVAPPPVPPSLREENDLFVGRITDYYRISAILWLIIAILQIISILGIVAGIWNLFASASRFQMIKAVRDRLPSVVEANRGVTQLVILGIVNLLLGAVVGILFVVFDFYIRDQVLKRADVFGCGSLVPPPPGVAPGQSMAEQLEKLHGLRQSNAITEAEYGALKKRLLG